MIEWNNKFVLDKQFREKYGIAFNSEAHRNVCQIDVYLEHLENTLYKEHADLLIAENYKKEQYNKGILIEPKKLSEKEELDVYDKIDFDINP